MIEKTVNGFQALTRISNQELVVSSQVSDRGEESTEPEF
jgi:hypothetical protein